MKGTSLHFWVGGGVREGQGLPAVDQQLIHGGVQYYDVATFLMRLKLGSALAKVATWHMSIIDFSVYLQVVPVSWDILPWAHYLFIFLNITMWWALYYANSRDPGFLPCHSPDYDMALKQVRISWHVCRI